MGAVGDWPSVQRVSGAVGGWPSVQRVCGAEGGPCASLCVSSALKFAPKLFQRLPIISNGRAKEEASNEINYVNHCERLQVIASGAERDSERENR